MRQDKQAGNQSPAPAPAVVGSCVDSIRLIISPGFRFRDTSYVSRERCPGARPFLQEMASGDMEIG